MTLTGRSFADGPSATVNGKDRIFQARTVRRKIGFLAYPRSASIPERDVPILGYGLWKLFDRYGFYDLALLDENHIRTGALEFIDCLAVSGGDTIAMAEGLGKEGATQLETFLRRGGLYLGSCAGAYLPLNSSKEHLRLFNFVKVRITNLTKEVPDSITLPGKSITPYGCSYLFHPVREAVEVDGSWPSSFCRDGVLFSPSIRRAGNDSGEGSEVLARYSGFTKKTLFLSSSSAGNIKSQGGGG